MVANFSRRKKKQFVEKLLRIKGIDYDEWLDDQHSKVIEENQDVMMMALETFLSVDNDKLDNEENKHVRKEKSLSTNIDTNNENYSPV